MKKREAFTLIELIAVLVILAILALIITPLVLNIIRKARTSADKRSIDAYGRSIELAIADYLLDNGSFPTSIEQLTIEYIGDKVVCNTTTLNEDTSVYLSECTVGGRSVEGYTYGKDNTPTYKAYSVGDEVTYNNVDYYVLKDSEAKNSTLTLLKAEPLTVAEINEYAINHINKYLSDNVGIADDRNGFGGMAYYSSATCGNVNGNWIYSGCKTNYAQSDIKYAIDAWAKSNLSNGAKEARLITLEDLFDNLECTESDGCIYSSYNWLYNSNYYYWTMSSYNNSMSEVWILDPNGGLSRNNVFNKWDFTRGVVRPVIVIDKSVLN